MPKDDTDRPDHTAPLDNESRNLWDASFLATAYGANLGGTGAITGTGPNLIMKSVLEGYYSEPTGLNFLTWMVFCVPVMLICTFLTWVWLQVLFLGLLKKKKANRDASPERVAAVRELVESKYRELGPLTSHELMVLTLFVLLILLWMLRAPEFIPGWAQWFKDAYDIKVRDATPALLVVILLFALPARFNFLCLRRESGPRKDNNACLTWNVVQEKVPWGVLIILGGGFAMAGGANKSGVSSWIGAQLYFLNGVREMWIVVLVSLMTSLLTEVISNTSTATILMPVLNELALSMNVNPVYLMLPATLSCSFAFMLPVATPPNAIVYEASGMKTTDMMRAGLVMNIICVFVVNIMINTLGFTVFDLAVMPAWTNSSTF